MKHIITLAFLLLYIFSFSQTQEEIWGYHSLAGSEGGGLVFRVDPDSLKVETVHRFGYGERHGDKPENRGFLSNIDGVYYGITAANYNLKSELYSYNNQENEISFLSNIEGYNCEVSAVDENFIYISVLDNTNTAIYAYDKAIDTIGFLIDLPEELGNDFQGAWLDYGNGLYYVFTMLGGEYNHGTLVEINVLLKYARKIIDFDEEFYPVGRLLSHSNGKIYGTLARGLFNSKGSIIEVDIENMEFSVLSKFISSTGEYPIGELFETHNGYVYGATNYGGEFSDGSIYKFNPEDNSIEAVYYFNNDTEEFENLKFYGGFSQLSDNKLVGILERTGGPGPQGKIFSFDMQNHELQIEYDFEEGEIQDPIGHLTYDDGEFIGIAQEVYYNKPGGIISFDPISKNVSLKKSTKQIEECIDGQNPKWMCQGDDGNIYGITSYGGKDNKGVVFKINYYTHEFTKKMDVADIDFPFSPKAECWAIAPGIIIGMSQRLYVEDSVKNGKGSYTSIFEYNFLENKFNELLIIPEVNYRGVYGPGINSKGNLFFNDRTIFYEYNYENNELITKEIPELTEVGYLIETEPDVYIGWGGPEPNEPSYTMLFSWNTQTNEISVVLNHKRIIEVTGRVSPGNKLHISADSIIYGDLYYATSGGGYIIEYAYDMKNDSLLSDFFLHGDFDGNTTQSMMEPKGKDCFIQNSLVLNESCSLLEIYKKNEGRTDTLYLEETPIHYYYGPWQDWAADINLDFTKNVDLFEVLNPDRESYWIGVLDTNWYEEKNWFANKQPSSLADVVIPYGKANYPVLDTTVNIGSIFIYKTAQIQFNPTASLSCDKIFNEGKLNLFANEVSRASLIYTDSVINNGKIIYSYFSDKKEKVLLGSPVRNVNSEDYDSIKVWGFDGQDWELFEDSPNLFNPIQAYMFEIDSANGLQFSGVFNNGSFTHQFNENSSRIQPVSNPYPASLNWRYLHRLNESNRALYKYNAHDSTFTSYCSALGDASALILPLEVFWVDTENNNHFLINNGQRIHAIDFEEYHSVLNPLLVLKVEGLSGSNRTHIGFNPYATAGFDPEYDALKNFFLPIAPPQVFTYTGDEKLDINQLPDTAMMDMAVNSREEGNYTISIDENSSFEFVVLEDLIWNKRVDLLKENYSFDYSTTDGDYPFKLYFNPSALKPLSEVDIDVFYYPENLVIRSQKRIEQATILFFDLAGKEVLELQAENFHYYKKAISLPGGHYIVQVRTGDLIVNTKVLVRR